MRVRAYGGIVGTAVHWNPVTSSPMEVIVRFEDGSADSVPIANVEPEDESLTRTDLSTYLWSLER